MAKRKQAPASGGRVIEIVPKDISQGRPPAAGQAPEAEPRGEAVIAHPDVARIFAENSRLRADNMHLRGRLAQLESKLGERPC